VTADPTASFGAADGPRPVARVPAAAPSAAAPSAAVLPRLLPTAGEPAPLGPAAHQARYGPLPARSGAQLFDVVQAAGLTGRGGAAFATHRKLRAVAAGRRPIVVGNGAEGEPASAKDALLLGSCPQLVLDGLQVAARAVGARRCYLYLHADARLEQLVRRALQERGAAARDEVPVTVVAAPARFLAGEESALARRISGGPALPWAVPPRVFERGVGGRPTLVQNVETLAHLALIARYGPDWFRALGTAEEPGSALFTVGGCVPRPVVVEAALGTPVRDLLTAGGVAAPLQAVLFGGYHGAWLAASQVEGAVLTNASLRPRGTMLGAGVVLALPASGCGVVETARAARYLAAESAGQCGPCLNGLPSIASALAELAGPGHTPTQQGHLRRWLDMIEHRGACHHPDGFARFVRSALRVFAREFDLHASGRCTATSRAAVLPLAPGPAGPQDWS
jgi:NADH:ubiquinone oxidoreductase subunit F (NADH-binding)